MRFCVNYRGFNRITKKDKYLLPLIYETLRNIGKTKWYIKLDVRAAFHKIRITEKDEWMIAFKTRYGLFEWLVIPFGLANTLNIFQKYINWAVTPSVLNKEGLPGTSAKAVWAKRSGGTLERLNVSERSYVSTFLSSIYMSLPRK